MNSSPERRRWSAWCSQANTNAAVDRVAVDRDERVLGVLLDDREQVAEQPALVLLQDGDVRDADRCGLL